MAMLADISVVIPTYNRPKLLLETVRSVLAQSVLPREIIIVDNGTDDETGELVTMELKDKVRYVRVPPEGLQAARNAGVSEATSTWVATLDDDDLWPADHLETAAMAIEDGRADAIFADNRRFRIKDGALDWAPLTNFEKGPAEIWKHIPRPEPGQRWSFVGNYPVELLLLYNPFYASGMVARRTLIQRVGSYDPAVRGIKAEDIEFLSRLLPKARVAVLWEPFGYRIHETNASGNNLLAQAIGRWQIFEMIAERGAGGSQEFARALAENLPRRRAELFDRAWRSGRYDVTRRLSPLLRQEDWTFERRLKGLVQRSPRILQSVATELRTKLPRHRARQRLESGAW